MVGKREEKRAALLKALIDAAAGVMKQSGLGGVRARDIAKDAGCALGSLYTVFDDIDELILNVNARTLDDLGAKLEMAVKKAKSPSTRLLALAKTYLSFARNNPNMWAALFDHRMPPDSPIPDWYLDKQKVLFEHVTKPLSDIRPDINARQAGIQARVIFTAVHGIVAINVQHRFLKLPDKELDVELERFIKTHINGMS